MIKTAALGIVLSAGVAANAQVLNFGNTGLLGSYQYNEQQFVLGGSGAITGFTITADMLQAGSAGSWQGDMKLLITSPSNQVFEVGGYTNLNYAWNAASLGGTGTFPGNSGDPGQADATYPFNFGDVAGTWTVRLTNDWDYVDPANHLEWNNVTITLVPAPGAAALMGIGGVLALRRRR